MGYKLKTHSGASKRFKKTGSSIKSRGANRKGIIASCIYKACSIQGCPRSTQEIADIFKIDTKNMTKGCKNFDTIIGERGLNLSAGQKQRLGIARALYRKPELLILDESTSSLDFDTEEKFINDVFSYSDDKTIIFISHKASALKKCDKIYDLNQKNFVK